MSHSMRNAANSILGCGASGDSAPGQAVHPVARVHLSRKNPDVASNHCSYEHDTDVVDVRMRVEGINEKHDHVASSEQDFRCDFDG